MAGSYNSRSNNDSIDISELASLNQDISDDLLNELENKLSSEVKQSSASVPVNDNDDSTLFEEPAQKQVPAETLQADSPQIIDEPREEIRNQETSAPESKELPAEKSNKDNVSTEDGKKEEIVVNQSFDDNFIKKYKAKLNKKAQSALMNGKSVDGSAPAKYMQEQEGEPESIETLSNGNISEHPLGQGVKEYNESLDFLDGNIKYSKYVIYIEPKNVDFIDSLTVKERKNLINNILRQQDDIAITKQRFALIQTIIRQVIIAILTIAISIPTIYYVINASLEATIDNYRRSQTNWQVLYKEHGKISPK